MEKGQVFGQSCTGLLAKYDQNTRLLKMFQLSLFEEEPESLETLPKSGMTVNGKLWEQTMWAHPTGGNESGLWLTPTVIQIKPRTPEKMALKEKKRNASGRETVPPGTLQEQVGMSEEKPLSDMRLSKMWPTPATKGYGHGSEGQYQNLYKKMMQGEITKEEMEIMITGKLENHRSYKKMQKMWPTPQSRDYKGPSGRSMKGEENDLPNAVKMWPTPRASEWKDVGPVGSKSHTHMDKRDYLCAKVKDPEQPTGSLNPQWVEWLMGYPIGWTDLKD